MQKMHDLQITFRWNAGELFEEVQDYILTEMRKVLQTSLTNVRFMSSCSSSCISITGAGSDALFIL
jgi:hypothetical protein